MNNPAQGPAEDHSLKTLSTREADSTWMDLTKSLTQVKDCKVADIGCGEGIYCRAFAKLGASEVHGFDNCSANLSDAKIDSSEFENVHFHQTDATNLNVDDESFDLVNIRSLLHHVPHMKVVLMEACRILKPGGRIIVQDRVPEDVLQPASPTHLRGYFFESIPRLVKLECENRFTELDIQSALLASGMRNLKTQKIEEVRNQYSSIEALNEDLRRRKSRSILQHLSNNELEQIINHIDQRLRETNTQPPLVEVDRWTVITALK